MITTETNTITTTHKHLNKEYNVSIDVSDYLPIFEEMNETFGKIKKRTIDKIGYDYAKNSCVIVDKVELPTYKEVFEKDGYHKRRVNVNEIDNIANTLNEICQKLFTADFFDSGASVIGMCVQIKVVRTRKRTSDNIILVRQYGQGEGFNYVYQRRIIQLIEKYIPNMFPYVNTSVGRMD